MADYQKLEVAENAIKRLTAEHRSIAQLSESIDAIREGLGELDGLSSKIAAAETKLAAVQALVAEEEARLHALQQKNAEIQELYQTVKSRLAALR